MTTLHTFIGIPGSKRKELAQEFAREKGYTYLWSDDVRDEMIEKYGEISNTLLFEELHRRIKKMLDKGEEVVFDATNLYAKHRKHLNQLIKKYKAVAYYVSRTLDSCIEEEAKEEKSLGRDFVIQKFMTAEIPFAEEGFKNIHYRIEPVSTVVVGHYLTEKNALNEDDDIIAWAEVFMKTGKPILDSRPDGQHKKIGYNNMSAQIAFQTLYTMNYHVDFIKDVVQLILYKNRLAKANEKGKEKLKTQIGEELYQKLEQLVELNKEKVQ